VKKPGILVRLPDDRVCIVYEAQPLIAEYSKVVLHLVDDSYNIIIGANGRPKLLMKDVSVYNEEMQAATLIGYVD